MSPEHIHHAFIPVRAYYHLMRWIFGKNYHPFATAVKEGLHPLPAFMKEHQNKIRNIYFGFIYVIPTLILALMMHSIHKIIVKRFYGVMKK